MKRLIVGTIAAAALLLAVPAWAVIGEPTDLPGVDIVPSTVDADGNVIESAGTYMIDETTGDKRAFVRFALGGPSETRGVYAVLLYDRDGSLLPVGGGQIAVGDGVNPFIEFAGSDGNGIRVLRETDGFLYVCGISYFRGKVRDLAGYDSNGRCSTLAGAMELDASGTSPGGAGSFG